MARKKFKRKKKRLKNNVILYVDGGVEKDYFNHLNINSKDNVYFNIKIGDERDYIRNQDDEEPHLLIVDVDATEKKVDPKKRYSDLKSLKNDDNVFFNNYAFETFLLQHVKPFNRPIMKSKEYDNDMNECFGLSRVGPIIKMRKIGISYSKRLMAIP